MSLVRIFYNVRPWSFRSPALQYFERFGFDFTPPAEMQAFLRVPNFEIRSAIASEEIEPAKFDKNGFKVALNMKDFKPGEFVVKTVDNAIIVEAKCDRKDDDQQGTISREFLRKYVLPKAYDPTKVESTLTSDGVLTIMAPPPPVDERIVQIKQIENPKESKSDGSKE